MEMEMVLAKKIIENVYLAIARLDPLSDASFWKGYLHLAKTFGHKSKKLKQPKSTPVLWEPPQEDMVKLNTDRSVYPDAAGGGGLIRGHDGVCIIAFQFPTQAACSTEAELAALEFGCELLHKYFPNKHWWIEFDAKVLLLLLNREQSGHWKLRNGLQRIKNLVRGHGVKFSHVFREGNQPADYLANTGCIEQVSMVYFNHGPKPLQVLCRMDQMGLPYFRNRFG